MVWFPIVSLALAALPVPVPPLQDIEISKVESWEHARGPRFDGSGRSPLVASGVPLHLQLRWRVPLGSGYSGIAITAGRVMTLHSDDEVDVAVCLDASDGSERWRRVLGPRYLGHDGSEDGPVSSPCVGGGALFALTSQGRFVALELADGAERWSVDLIADFGAVAPEYAFSTSPLVVGDLVVVQAGGAEGSLLCAFDVDDGSLRWRVGQGEGGYQSPVLVEAGGGHQLVVMNGAKLFGVDPASGRQLWSHALKERESAGMGMPTPLGEGRFLCGVRGALAGFRIERSEAEWAVARESDCRVLGRGYSAPVHHDGLTFGLQGDILTCADTASGERRWRSRAPGGTALLLVGDRLLIFGPGGVLVLARASGDGYLEEARTQALTRTSLTWPSFADDCVYLRTSEELACVVLVPTADIADAGEPDAPAPALSRAGGSFPALVGGWLAADDPHAAADSFLAAQETLPLVEDGWVHFLYQGDAEDVAITGSMTGSIASEPLAQIPGTNVHYASYPIEAGARWEYGFQVDFERPTADPRNPARVASVLGGELSEVRTKGYRLAHHLAGLAPEAVGRLEAIEYTSESLGNQRSLQVYLPAGYDHEDRRYPLLLVHQGGDWLKDGEMAGALDRLIDSGAPAVVVVFIDPISEWWFEGGGTRTTEYVDMLATELVPFLEARFRLSDRARDRALHGVESFGITAAYGALRHPDVFGGAAIQSMALSDVARHDLFKLIRQGPSAPTRFYVDWNRYDARHIDRLVDHAGHSRRLARTLRREGFNVTGGEGLDCFGWRGWVSRLDRVLSALFPEE